jgi:hypothetical protein
MARIFISHSSANNAEAVALRPGCTTHDIQFDAWVSCPSGGIIELRKKGVPIISVGHKKYAAAHPLEMYAIAEPPKASI